MKKSTKLLNIGCGQSHIQGFINMDIVQPYDIKLDVRSGLPFKDQEIDGIYSEHFFEHLTMKEGLHFLRECRRVLKSDGRMRIAIPDLDSVISRYTSDNWRGNADMFEMGFDWVSTRCEMLNIAMREWGHKYLYNEEELTRVASLAGLKSDGQLPHGISETPHFKNLETRNGSGLIMEFWPRHKEKINEPYVSILIPAYRSKYFKEALQSALSQTYSNIEIIICDDSANNTIGNIIRELTQEYPDVDVIYQNNESRKGNLGNFLECLSLAKGRYIKFLNDDDFIESDCVEKMCGILLNNPQISLAFSHRKIINNHGELIQGLDATKLLYSQDCEIEGQRLATVMLLLLTNIVGEPSTVMFRLSDIADIKPNLVTFGGRVPMGAGDVALWLNLLSKGNAYYFSKSLSSFRIHDEQRQKQPHVQKGAAESWVHLLKHARRLGLLQRLLFWQLLIKVEGDNSWKKIYLFRPSILARQSKNVLIRLHQEIRKGNFIKLVRFIKTHFLS